RARPPQPLRPWGDVQRPAAVQSGEAVSIPHVRQMNFWGSVVCVRLPTRLVGGRTPAIESATMPAVPTWRVELCPALERLGNRQLPVGLLAAQLVPFGAVQPALSKERIEPGRVTADPEREAAGQCQVGAGVVTAVF